MDHDPLLDGAGAAWLGAEAAGAGLDGAWT
jgi:hypothetical protein